MEHEGGTFKINSGKAPGLILEGRLMAAANLDNRSGMPNKQADCR
jgi:hypothetical protein